MTRLWAICRTTFLQTIRQPIYGVLILVTFAMLVINLSLSGYTFGSDQKMMENIGLSTLLVTGLLVAAFSAASALSREIEDKTALTVISKPVSRATFVLGKFAGVAAAVALAYYLCALVFLMVVRHQVRTAVTDPFDWPVIVLGCSAMGAATLVALAGNLMFAWTFTSAGVWSATVLMSAAMGIITFVGKGWQIVPFGHDIPVQLLVGMALMLLAVTVFVAVAVAASTRLGQVMTLLVCCGVFFLGSMHRALFPPQTRHIVVLRVLGAVLPNLADFYPLDALTQDKAIPGVYVALAGAYCALYVAGALAVGIAMFQTRTLEAQGPSATMPAMVAVLAWTGRIAALGLGIAGGVMLSVPRFHTLSGLAAIAAMLVAAAAGWIIWGLFGRGARWAYWLVLGVTVAAVARQVAVLAGGEALERARLPAEHTGHLVLGTVVAAAVLLVLILPGTRRHFRSDSLHPV